MYSIAVAGMGIATQMPLGITLHQNKIMRKHFIKFAGAVLLALSLQTAASAVPISGNLNFLGVAQLDSADLSAATKVNAILGFAGTADGSFSGISFATPVAFTLPWSFTSGAVNDFWSVGGFTLDLASSWVVTQNATFLNVVGTGTLRAIGYDDTPGTWSFTIPGASANSTFTFAAASSAVPDGGMTLVLTGAGLVAIAAIRRFRVLA